MQLPIILKLAREHAGALEIFALSPLTPLHRALDRKGGAKALGGCANPLHSGTIH